MFYLTTVEQCLYDGVYLNAVINGDLFKEEFWLLQYKQTIQESVCTAYSPFDRIQNETKETVRR
jgi:hypothetical protein